MKKLLLSIVCLFSFVKILGQERLVLEDVLRRTLENNYQITIQRIVKDKAERSNTWGMAGRYPSLSLAGEMTSSLSNADSTDTKIDKQNIGVSSGWTLFNGFKVNYIKRSLQLNSEFVSGSLAVLLETTVQSVVMAYYNIIYHQKRLMFARQAFELSKTRLEAESTAREIGVGGSFKELQAKAAYLEDKSNVIAAEKSLKDARRNLNYIMGADLTYRFVIEDELGSVKEDYVLDDLKSKMLKDNFNIKNQLLAIELAKNEIAVAKADYMPKLSASGHVGLNKEKIRSNDLVISDDESVNWYAALSLSYTLFNGGRIRINHKLAKLEAEINSMKLIDTNELLTKELFSLYDQYLVDIELVKVALENVSVAKMSYDTARELYDSGTLNSVDFREVQLKLLAAQNNVALSKLNLQDDFLSLVRITGGMLSEYNILVN